MMKGNVPRTEIDQLVNQLRSYLYPDYGGPSVASVMVGAGFSRNASARAADVPPMPLWHELTAKMLERLGPADPRFAEPLRLAQLFEARFGRADLERFLEHCIPDIKYQPGPLHLRLLELPWADVFTTNYDTLLERASSEVGRRYERVLSVKDIPLRPAPRLVKLHGTLGTGNPLIVTQEDYRCYLRSHESFVNLVRQATMESVLVLLGFGGDDPNFLEWTGWVRDALGILAPKIYLVGVLDLSAAERVLLEKRQVTPVDLAPLFEKSRDRHASAVDWFLAALEHGKRARDSHWAPLSPLRIEEREPPLPPAKAFTYFSPEPLPEWRSAPLTRFQELEDGWRAQRLEYPGWHVAPDAVRTRVEQGLDWWRVAVFDRAKELPPVKRLKLIHELCWRLELTLSPVWTNEADLLAAWLEEANPFAALLGLRDAETVPSGDTSFEELWCCLAVHVLRTAREDLAIDRFVTWSERLERVAAEWPVVVGEVRYERALLHLNRLDLVQFEKAIDAWAQTASTPLEWLRLAALYAELKDKDVAASFALQALSAIRSGNKTPRNIALDAWCCILLSMLDWQEEDKRQRWSQRLRNARAEEYNPWETIERFRGVLKDPAPPWAQTHGDSADFDAHSIGSVRKSGGHADPAAGWQLLRLVERAPCPLFAGELSLAGEIAAHAAIWVAHGAPAWAFSILVRARAKPGVWNDLFGREAVTVMPEERIQQLYAMLLTVIDEALPPNGTSIQLPTYRARREVLVACLEVLSRLLFRATELQRKQVLDRLVLWFCQQGLDQAHDLRGPLNQLTKRVIDSLPTSELGAAVVELLLVPIPGESRFRPQFPEHWVEPFQHIMSRKARLPGRTPEVECRVAELLTYASSPSRYLRVHSIVRLLYLHECGWLSDKETAEFSRAVWSHVDAATGLPVLDPYLPNLSLILPGAGDYDAADKVKRYLLCWEPPEWPKALDARLTNGGQARVTQLWLKQVRQTFFHPRIRTKQVEYVRLSEEEAVKFLQRLTDWAREWFALLGSKNWARVAFEESDRPGVFARSFCETLGDSVLPWMQPNSAHAASIKSLLQEMITAGLPVAGAAVGVLHVDPSSHNQWARLLEVDLTRDNDETVRHAAYAAGRWAAAADHEFLPHLPKRIVDTLVSRASLRARPALSPVLQVLRGLVASGQLDQIQNDRLLQALDLLASETAPEALQMSFQAREIGRKHVAAALSARAYAAMLARAMRQCLDANALSVPNVLIRWHSIAESEPLPEVRQAWEV